MLTAKENERFTRVGPGTPMGVLLRRYWHPVAAAAELAQEPTRAVRLLGEDLVLYRDRSGTLGLIQEACAHRRVNMLYGIPEEHGLRCPYHGWLYDETGRCLEMPAEAPDSTFKDRVEVAAYPVQEMGGLVFAYLGPSPAPLLPRWDLLVMENVHRHIGFSVVPCNWLQTMENSLDPVHLEHLHGTYFQYQLERETGGNLSDDQRMFIGSFKRHHVKIGFEVFEHGIIKRRVLEGETEESEGWRVGHPILFPNILRLGGGLLEFQFRVPMDDTHTKNFWYACFDPGPGAVLPRQDSVPFHEVPHTSADGRLVTNYVDGQDMMVWAAAGEVSDRTQERLGVSDQGVILYRRLLKEQMEVALDGGDPMNVLRDPAQNESIAIAQEESFYTRTRHKSNPVSHSQAAWYGPVVDEIVEAMAGAARASEGPAR